MRAFILTSVVSLALVMSACSEDDSQSGYNYDYFGGNAGAGGSDGEGAGSAGEGGEAGSEGGTAGIAGAAGEGAGEGGSSAGNGGSNAGEGGTSGSNGGTGGSNGGTGGSNGGTGGSNGGTGGSNGGTGGSAPLTCSTPFLSTCAACMDVNCCASWLECENSAACSSYVDCLSGCSSDACANNCEIQYATGAKIFNKVEACGDSKCAQSCSELPYTSCSEVNAGSASCNSCMQASCCAEVEACVNDIKCRDLQNCLGECSTDACIQNCASQHSGGISKTNDMFQCLEGCSACN